MQEKCYICKQNNAIMKEEVNSNPEMKLADDLVGKGDKAFLSYTWKLNKSHDDSSESSDVNPYSDDNWANDISYPEHDLEMAFDYYQQALARYQKLLDPEHIKIGEVLSKCGRVSMDPMYDKDISQNFLERVLPIYQKEKPYSRDLALLYEDLGKVCHAMNKLPSSLDYYYKSLSLFNELTICGEEEDVSELKERIKDAEQKLGLHVIHDGDKLGFADKEGNVIIPCIWNDVKEFSEGLAVVKDTNNLWGYINYNGDVVISCLFRDAHPFEGGMAYVEANVDDIYPQTSYLDKDDYRVASDFALMPHQIDAVYEASVLAKHGKYFEAAERIRPAVSSMDPNPRTRQLSYYSFAEQYDKVVEICEKICKFDERPDLVSYANLLLGFFYEEGRGVEKDLMRAFNCFKDARLYDEISDEDFQLLDNFLDRHPELKELPEVQNALAPYDDDEEF